MPSAWSLPSTDRRPRARGRWPSGWRRISGCPTSTPACSTGRSAGRRCRPARRRPRWRPGSTPDDLADPALRTDEAGQQASKVGRDPGGPGQPIEIPERILISAAGRGARRPRYRHRDLPRRPGEIVRHRQPGGPGRAAVSGVAGAGGRHYKTARSCRDGGAGPSRQRTGGCTSKSRARCLASRYH